jgi:hypothetical protein
LRQKWKLIFNAISTADAPSEAKNAWPSVCCVSAQDRRLVRAAGEHRVFERVELVFQRGIDVRIRVTKEVDPP